MGNQRLCLSGAHVVGNRRQMMVILFKKFQLSMNLIQEARVWSICVIECSAFSCGSDMFEGTAKIAEADEENLRLRTFFCVTASKMAVNSTNFERNCIS